MNIEQLWEEIENEYSWRIEEIRFLRNQISRLSNDSSRKILRRSVILMLYAHFEGFFKFAFNLYIRSVNDLNLECHDVNTSILVSSFSEIFKDLRNSNRKSNIFRKPLPDDSKLHAFARSVEFMEKLDENLGMKVNVSESVINTESNLKPNVLTKLLYSLGLDHELFRDEYGNINHLLNVRNKIAHGESKMGIDSDKFETSYHLTLKLLRTIKSKIMKSLVEESYKKVA